MSQTKFNDVISSCDLICNCNMYYVLCIMYCLRCGKQLSEWVTTTAQGNRPIIQGGMPQDETKLDTKLICTQEIY